MASRIRFPGARAVFETFPDLRHRAPPPEGDCTPTDHVRRLLELGASRPGDLVSRVSAAAAGGGMVGPSMCRRVDWTTRRRRGVARRRTLGQGADRRQSPRGVADRRLRRSPSRDDMARPRRRLVRRLDVPSRAEAVAGAGHGLRASRQRGHCAGGLRGRSDGRDETRRRLRRGWNTVCRRRRGAGRPTRRLRHGVDHERPPRTDG